MMMLFLIFALASADYLYDVEYNSENENTASIISLDTCIVGGDAISVMYKKVDDKKYKICSILLHIRICVGH